MIVANLQLLGLTGFILMRLPRRSLSALLVLGCFYRSWIEEAQAATLSASSSDTRYRLAVYLLQDRGSMLFSSVVAVVLTSHTDTAAAGPVKPSGVSSVIGKSGNWLMIWDNDVGDVSWLMIRDCATSLYRGPRLHCALT